MDQGRVGCQVVLGKANNELCPVTAVTVLGGCPGALFQWQEGTPPSKAKFVEAIRQGLPAANLPALQFSGHSFRIGAATTATMVGLQNSAIQMLGRWRSDCYQLYIIRSSPQHFIFLVKKFNVTRIIIT